MGKHVYNNPKDKHLTEAIKTQLHKSQLQGMSVGVRTVSAVVLKKLEHIADDSSAEEMLAAIKEVRDFCNVPLNDKVLN